MRKIFFLLFTLSLGVSAMSQSEKYTINITVADSADVSELYLYKININNLADRDAAVDTIKVLDKKAVFTGLLSDLKSTPIGVLIGEGVDQSLIVFEEGTIDVVLGKIGFAKGTALNNKMYDFKMATSPLETKLKAFGEKFQNGNLTDAEKQQLVSEAKPLSDDLSMKYKNFALGNLDNSLGQFFTLSMLQGMDGNEIQSVLAKAPEEFKTNPQVVARLAQIKLQEEAQGLGLPYKDITLKSPDGVNVALSDHIGKNELVLIDFWASWCGPCIKEMPTLVKAYEQFKDKGFEIVGISLDNNREAWLGAINRLKMTWVHMSDLEGWQSSAAQLYGIQSIPQTLLVNKEGKIVGANLRGEALISKIESLLNK